MSIYIQCDINIGTIKMYGRVKLDYKVGKNNNCYLVYIIPPTQKLLSKQVLLMIQMKT